MIPRKLPLFDGFIETPFERRFQGLLRESWHDHRWHVIVAEPGSGKTMGICDLRDEATRAAGTRTPMIERRGHLRSPIRNEVEHSAQNFCACRFLGACKLYLCHFASKNERRQGYALHLLAENP